MLLSAVDFSHKLLKETVSEGDTVIDATVGNGSDTVLLATLVGWATHRHSEGRRTAGPQSEAPQRETVHP